MLGFDVPFLANDVGVLGSAAWVIQSSSSSEKMSRSRFRELNVVVGFVAVTCMMASDALQAPKRSSSATAISKLPPKIHSEWIYVVWIDVQHLTRVSCDIRVLSGNRGPSRFRSPVRTIENASNNRLTSSSLSPPENPCFH